MIDLDSVILRRADEQVAAVRLDHRWERDGGAIVGPGAPVERPAKRANCLAGDCSARPTKLGYCHAHYMKIRGGVALDVDVQLRRSDARRTA